MPLMKKCRVCGKTFATKRFFVRNGGGKYCSRDCHYEGVRKGKFIKCFLCLKETYKSPQQIRRSKSRKYFCGKSCQTKWRNSVFVGPRHANWIHGESAYKSVLTREGVCPICKRCKKTDKRVLAVHHVDGDKRNNRVENLVWLCHNCHHLIHHHNDERDKFMVLIA